MIGFQELLVALLLQASLITGLPVHVPIDVAVVRSSPCEIQAAMVPDEPCKTDGLRVVALYDPIANTVHLSDDWTGTDLREQSTLLHELVHYLQDVNGEAAACVQEFEKQAYDAELEFMRLNGMADPLRALGIHPVTYTLLTTCPPLY